MSRLLIVTCLLAGCAAGSRNASLPEVYDFGLPLARVAVGNRWSSVAFEVSASPWLDSRDAPPCDRMAFGRRSTWAYEIRSPDRSRLRFAARSGSKRYPRNQSIN